MKPINLLLSTLALANFPQQEQRDVFATSHKERTKRDATPKAKKPGRGKAAKGYDPETKTWRKYPAHE